MIPLNSYLTPSLDQKKLKNIRHEAFPKLLGYAPSLGRIYHRHKKQCSSSPLCNLFKGWSKEKILMPKFNSLLKHVGKHKAKVASPRVEINYFYLTKTTCMNAMKRFLLWMVVSFHCEPCCHRSSLRE
jgi:hypothetical protein